MGLILPESHLIVKMQFILLKAQKKTAKKRQLFKKAA